MQESQSLQVGGAMVFWNCGRFVQRVPLLDGLARVGFNKFAPGPRTAVASLRSALEEVFPSKSHRIESLTKKDSFEVIEIDRGETRNEYRHRYWVGIDKDAQIDCRPFSYDTAEQIAKAYNKHRGLVTANEVTSCLLAIVAKLDGSCHLRPKGHVYWLPAQALATWREIAYEVEACPTQGEANRMTIMSHAWGPDEVRAVRDAITREVETESARLHSEILGENALGEKALEHRKEQALALRRKVMLYEGLLDTGLGSLRASLDQVEEAACAATLLVSAAAMAV